jgi:hypothetical protein
VTHIQLGQQHGQPSALIFDAEAVSGRIQLSANSGYLAAATMSNTMR